MACSVCNRRRKSIGAMKGSKKLMGNLMDVAAGTAGFVASSMLNKVEFIGANPTIAGAVKLIGGAILAGSSKGITQKVAMGVAIGGGVELSRSLLTKADGTAIFGIGSFNPRGSTSYIAGRGPIVD